ncbi:MAG: N-acetylmuramoyl-L-alanine amidase [Candidatus Methylomirabilales bacterium]
MNVRHRVALGVVILSALAVGVVLLALGRGPWSAAAQDDPAAAQEDPLAGKRICVDAGHGGSDPGAVNGDLQEEEINLDVARYLEQQWSERGATVIMTRTSSDQTLSSRDRYTKCNEAGADILVSVHTNSFSDPTIDGLLLFYFQNEDRVLAQALHESMWAALQPTAPEPTTFTDFGTEKNALGVLLKSGMASATVEPVMMSDSGEASRLATAIADCTEGCRRLEIAQSIIDGVDNYFENYAGQSPEGPGRGRGGGP